MNEGGATKWASMEHDLRDSNTPSNLRGKSLTVSVWGLVDSANVIVESYKVLRVQTRDPRLSANCALRIIFSFVTI
jgi:hypothetical protein